MINIPKKKKCKKAKWLSELRGDEKRNAKEKGKDTHLNAEYQRTARLQQYVNRELPDVQAGFRKGRRTRDQIANIHWIIEKAREIQKNIYFCFIDYTKAFDCVDHNKLWKILKEMGIPDPPDLPLETPVCRSGSNS